LKVGMTTRTRARSPVGMDSILERRTRFVRAAAATQS